MIKIECSRCADWIQLPFHKKEELIKCPRCSETTRVKDVFVSGGPYIMHRDILIANMQKYRRLVSEAEKEILALQKKGAAEKAYEISARSLKMFVTEFKEMLDGCRDIVRHNINGLRTSFTVNGRKYHGNILNLSVSGICLDAGRNASVNRLWCEANVLLKGRNTGPFTVGGKIMWLSKDGRMGIRFLNVDEQAMRLIEEFIVEKTVKKI